MAGFDPLIEVNSGVRTKHRVERVNRNRSGCSAVQCPEQRHGDASGVGLPRHPGAEHRQRAVILSQVFVSPPGDRDIRRTRHRNESARTGQRVDREVQTAELSDICGRADAEGEDGRGFLRERYRKPKTSTPPSSAVVVRRMVFMRSLH